MLQKFDAGFMGAAFQRRSSQRQFQRLAEFSGDGILLGPRMNLERGA